MLAAVGLPTTRETEAADAEEAVTAAESIGYPVALKIAAAEMVHKSDAGGVLLGIADAAAVRSGVQDLQRKLGDHPILVQEMIPSGLELIIGGERTGATGPVVVVGLGGVMTEVLADAVFCRAPVSHQGALQLLMRLRNQQVLNGFRGAPKVDRDAIAGIIVTVSELLAGTPEILEIDLNPVTVHGSRAVVVDAFVRSE